MIHIPEKLRIINSKVPAIWTGDMLDPSQEGKYLGVSKNRGKPPKWMVYNGKPYEQMDDLGGFPLFLETPI